MTTISYGLLGNNGWPEDLFATGGEWRYGRTLLQQMDGWLHYITSVFCFCLDGSIPIAFFNVPGLVHNSQVAEFENIHEKLENVLLLTWAKCCINLAFGNMRRDYLYKLCHDVFGSLALTRKERKMDTRKKRQATLAWQTAEWGMRMLQTSFPWIKDWVVFKDRGERRIFLKMLVLIYNMRARMVRINQIWNTYMKHLMQNAKKDFSFDIYLCHTHPLGLGGPIGSEEGGTSRLLIHLISLI